MIPVEAHTPERIPAAKERIIQIAVAAVVVVAALVIWGAVTETDAAQSSAIFMTTDGLKIRFENGELTVTEDGEPVSEDRIERTRSEIKVLDEDGEVIHRILLSRDGDVVWSGTTRERLRFGPEPSLRIGVTLGSVSEALATQLGLEEDEVALIMDVEEEGPARDAGLERHDILTRVGVSGEGTWEELREALEDMEEGDSIELEVLRQGRPVTVTVKPEEWEGGRGLGYMVAPRSPDGPFAVARRYRDMARARGDIDFVPLPDGDNLMVLPDADIFPGRSEREERLERLERKLRRLERMLEKLVDEEGGESPPRDD